MSLVTNTVHIFDGRTVRVRIDPTLAVSAVVQQLCINLKIEQPLDSLILKGADGTPVTDDGLRSAIESNAELR